MEMTHTRTRTCVMLWWGYLVSKARHTASNFAATQAHMRKLHMHAGAWTACMHGHDTCVCVHSRLLAGGDTGSATVSNCPVTFGPALTPLDAHTRALASNPANPPTPPPLPLLSRVSCVSEPVDCCCCSCGLGGRRPPPGAPGFSVHAPPPPRTAPRCQSPSPMRVASALSWSVMDCCAGSPYDARSHAMRSADTESAPPSVDTPGRPKDKPSDLLN